MKSPLYLDTEDGRDTVRQTLQQLVCLRCLRLGLPALAPFFEATFTAKRGHNITASSYGRLHPN